MSSFKYQFVGHNACGFDNSIVFNSLPKSYISVRRIKTSRGFIKLSFKVRSADEDGREIPKNAEFVRSKCHITGSLKYVLQKHNCIY